MSQSTGCQVQIEFGNKKQMERFVKWFNKKGFYKFIDSKDNDKLTKGATTDENGVTQGGLFCAVNT